MQKHLAIVLLAAATAVASAQGTKATLNVGDPAPPLVIAKWVKGTPVAELGKGHVDVVEFWATWCGPCRQSIPHLTELAKKYKDKATFIGVDSFEHEASEATCFPKVEKFVTDFGDKMNYNVGIDGQAGVMGKTWMDAAGQNGIPTAFVVDKEGKIAWIGHPMMGLDEVVAKVIDGTFDAKAEAEKAKKARAVEEAAMAKQREIMAPLMAAIKAKDYPKAVEAIDKIVADNPKMKANLAGERFVMLANYDSAAAQKYAGELGDSLYKDNAMGLNQLAWTIVQDGSPIKQPDNKLAIKLAEKAVKLSKEDPNILDTLALAYFRDNRTKDAIATQKKAVDKASADKNFDSATLDEMKGRLKAYEKPATPSR